MPMQVFDNDPQPGYIRWAGVHIVYKGVDYAVQDGYTNKKYVWWDYDYPNVFQTSDTYPTGLTDDDVIVFLNKNGIHLTVPTTTVVDGSLIVPESILANAIAANTITGDKLVAGAISGREIAADAVGAAAIAAGAVLAEHIAADAVTSTHILAGSILAEHIAANAIQTNHIATGAVTAQKIAAGSITTSHISTSGLDASVIKTGTMLFNRVRGGTAELGGSGNGNGLLIVRDASGNERARLDNAGVTVVDANFLLRESRSNTLQSIVATTNLVNDHSFEMIPRKGNADAYQTFEVDETYLGNIYWWQPLPSPNKTVNPRVLSTYGTDAPQMALFDFQAVVVRGTNQYIWRQYVPIDHAAGLAGPYTVSAHCAAYGATTTNTTVYVDVYAVDATFSHIALLGWATIPITASEKFKWRRGFTTFRNLPSGTSFLEIQIYSSNDVPVLCDGVQLVVAPYPVVYDPESALWRHARNLAGYVNVEAVDIPPSVRLQRLNGQSIPTSTVTPIVWEGRQPGYNSAGMWNPNQSDKSQIYIPSGGKYMIVANIRWETNTNGFRMVGIYKRDGSPIAKTQVSAAYSGNSATTSLQVSTIYNFNPGDWFQIMAWQNSGSTLNISPEGEATHVTVYKIGA
ncbi:hypothetical protein [Thermaerobacter composti]|uniref:Tail fiber protein n=1 Tax=Thermaerobacter composti TaxID=554949 RepID=A0ABZ0QRR8_9FIRM|nr:hypothetical protein [Thermaerobacter composti]WPD20170.1 hypothetical protein Q5761_05950 [Thermaerobacter composti]